MSFFGMHPTFTHVPLIPGRSGRRGFTKSKHATFAPSCAASFAVAIPPNHLQ
jgi:hypothetical protein